MESTFSLRLREERERLGLTQKEFGHWGGVTRLAQWKYEHGDNSPSIDYVANLKHHPVDVIYLILGKRLPSDFADWEVLELTFKSFLQSFLRSPQSNESLDRLFESFQGQLRTMSLNSLHRNSVRPKTSVRNNARD